MMLDALATDDGFKVDQREVIMAQATREEKAGLFLDRLELCGERAFGLFMDALKEHQKHLHGVLEETRRTVDDNAQRERVAMSGEAVRKLLRKSTRRRMVEKTGREDGGRDGGTGWPSEVGSFDGLLDEGDDGQYIDCYTLTTR